MSVFKFAVPAVLSILSCVPARAQQTTVHFTTADGCRIEAFYLAPSSGSYTFINTHGLGSNKNEWGAFQENLRNAGYGYLSLDLRGHGASRECSGKTADYRLFSRSGWNNASRDITAAAAYLRKKGLSSKKMIFCGASVGANLSLKAAAESSTKPAALVLLSPGLEYAGVKTTDYFYARYSFSILTVAARDDGYAWQSSAVLNRTAGAKGRAVHFIEGTAGHGVNMFKYPSLIPAILAWVAGL